MPGFMKPLLRRENPAFPLHDIRIQIILFKFGKIPSDNRKFIGLHLISYAGEIILRKIIVSNADGSTRARHSNLRSSPLGLLAILVSTILGVEILVMMLLGHFDIAHEVSGRLGIELPINQHLALEGLVDGLLLTLIVFPVLYFTVFKSLHNKNKALAESEARLEERIEDRTRELNQTVNRLNRRQNEIFTLNETNQHLQDCETTEAIFQVVEDQLSTLFPSLSGNLLLIDDDELLPNENYSWGDVSLFQEKNLLNEYRHSNFTNAHVSEVVPPKSLDSEGANENTRHWRICLPLKTRTTSVGLLTLQAPFDPTGNEQGDELDRRGLFWGSLAESLAMSISNVKLRVDLGQQAYRDSLTGLYNRRYLNDFIERQLQKLERDPGPLSVLMIDIDHFKSYNDTYGHAGGDAVLMTLGTELNGWVRRGDIITRSGGEEFVAVLPGVDAATAMQRAEELRRRIQALNIAHAGRELGQVTVSIGVSVYPDHGVDQDALIHAADSAMYASKQAGRDQVSLAQTPPEAETPFAQMQRKLG